MDLLELLFARNTSGGGGSSGGGLPVVELTTVVDITSTTPTSLSTEDSNRLNEIIKSKSPISMYATIAGMDGATLSFVLNRIGDNSDGQYIGLIAFMGAMFVISFMRMNAEEWACAAYQYSLTQS